MNKKQLLKTTIVLCSSLGILLIAFTLVGSFYARLLFPIFRWEIQLLVPEVSKFSIEFENLHGQEMVTMSIKITPKIPNPPSRTMTVRWPPINMYIHAIILFSMLAAWPKMAFKGRLKLFALGLPFLFLLEMLDIPMLTVSRCQFHVHDLVTKEPMDFAILHAFWLKFLNSGGREFLSIFFGFLTLAAYHLLTLKGAARPRLHEEPGRNDPCPCGSGKKYKKCCMGKR